MNKYIEAAIIVFMGIIAPVQPLLLTVGALLFLDLFTALWYVIRQRGIKGITSAGLSRTMAKALFYSMIIVIGYYMEKNMLNFLVSISKISATYIALIEFKSLLENIDLVLKVNLADVIINKLSSKNLKIKRKRKARK